MDLLDMGPLPVSGISQSAVTGLGSLDLTLCALYTLSVLAVGFYFTAKERREREVARLHREQQQQQQQQFPRRQRRGAGNTKDPPAADDQVLEEYYLGGRRIPWWALGIADVSSYIDISGTMINTALIYALGVKGMYIEIRGGLCLFLAFQLAYTGKLSRRCPVKTRGEWCVSHAQVGWLPSGVLTLGRVVGRKGQVPLWRSPRRRAAAHDDRVHVDDERHPRCHVLCSWWRYARL